MTFQIHGRMDQTSFVVTPSEYAGRTPFLLQKVKASWFDRIFRGNQVRLTVYEGEDMNPHVITVSKESCEKLLKDLHIQPEKTGLFRRVHLGKTVAAALHGLQFRVSSAQILKKEESPPSIDPEDHRDLSKEEIQHIAQRLKTFGLEFPKKYENGVSRYRRRQFWKAFVTQNSAQQNIQYPSDITEQEARLVGRFMKERPSPNVQMVSQPRIHEMSPQGGPEKMRLADFADKMSLDMPEEYDEESMLPVVPKNFMVEALPKEISTFVAAVLRANPEAEKPRKARSATMSPNEKLLSEVIDRALERRHLLRLVERQIKDLHDMPSLPEVAKLGLDIPSLFLWGEFRMVNQTCDDRYDFHPTNPDADCLYEAFAESLIHSSLDQEKLKTVFGPEVNAQSVRRAIHTYIRNHQTMDPLWQKRYPSSDVRGEKSYRESKQTVESYNNTLNNLRREVSEFVQDDAYIGMPGRTFQTKYALLPQLPPRPHFLEPVAGQFHPDARALCALLEEKGIKVAYTAHSAASFPLTEEVSKERGLPPLQELLDAPCESQILLQDEEIPIGENIYLLERRKINAGPYNDALVQQLLIRKNGEPDTKVWQIRLPSMRNEETEPSLSLREDEASFVQLHIAQLGNSYFIPLIQE